MKYIKAEIEEHCNLERKPFYVYDLTEFRCHQGFTDVYFDFSNLPYLDGYEEKICGNNFVVSNKQFDELNLIYKYE